MHNVWEAAKEILRNNLSHTGFQLWVAPLQVEANEAGDLLLICPNAFVLRWVQTHYLPVIRQTLAEGLGWIRPVRLKIAPAGPRTAPVLKAPQPQLPLNPGKRVAGRHLNNFFTFERFVVGPSNRLAYQASWALARNETFHNRILFLTSGPGLGKSHLSQAVGNFLLQSGPAGRILYLSAEDFANEMVTALRTDQMPRFKERFRRECDTLLLEEVQFLSGKEKIQAELCYTLDTLLGLEKRLVFTSSFLPADLRHISRELRSRLAGGLITPIGPPDFSTRVEILSRKAEERNLGLSGRVLEYLAEHLTDDVRRLESALDCLKARSMLLNEPLSLQLAQEVIQDLQAAGNRLAVCDIQKMVCNYYQVSLAELLGRSRQKRLVKARQIALYFARLYTQKTLVELGKLFQRSHATVLHALHALERERRIQPRLGKELRFLEEKMAAAQVKGGSRKASTLRSDA